MCYFSDKTLVLFDSAVVDVGIVSQQPIEWTLPRNLHVFHLDFQAIPVLSIPQCPFIPDCLSSFHFRSND